MRFGDQPESSHFRDDTGRSFGGFGGGNALGCLIPLIMSRFGIGGVIILVIGYFILTSLGGLGGGGEIQQPASRQVTQSGQSTLDPQLRRFTLQVLGSTEDVWTKLLANRGVQYTPATLVFYSETGQSGCGVAQSAMGPFYCPTDQSIYLDTEFFTELSTRFQAPGDFAMAYVIAHEVGHHLQDVLGTLDQASAAHTQVSPRTAPPLLPPNSTAPPSAADQAMAACWRAFGPGEPTCRHWLPSKVQASASSVPARVAPPPRLSHPRARSPCPRACRRCGRT